MAPTSPPASQPSLLAYAIVLLLVFACAWASFHFLGHALANAWVTPTASPRP